jgi:hypothetical protein
MIEKKFIEAKIEVKIDTRIGTRKVTLINEWCVQ